MNWLDFVIIIFLVISIIGGIKNGLIKSVVGLAGVFVGIYFAIRYYIEMAARLTFLPETPAKVVAFIIILAGAILAAAIVSALLSHVASLLLLGWLNRLGGAAFGLVSGIIFTGAAIALCTKFQGTNSIISNSLTAQIILDFFRTALNFLPDKLGAIRSFFE